MRILCVQGIQSSVGASTIVANVSRILSELDHDVLVFDLNPNNLQRLHFNMEWQCNSGWALNICQQQSWYKAAFQCEQGIRFLPFGKITYKELQLLLSDSISDNWLLDQLSLLNLPSKTWVILNTSSELNTLSTQALKLSDIIIRVCEPSTNCLSQLVDSIQSSFINNDISLVKKSFYIINKLIPTSEIDRDIALTLKNLLLEQMIPVKIHFDENIKESLAEKTTVTSYAPFSPAAKEFRKLVIWLISHFNR